MRQNLEIIRQLTYTDFKLRYSGSVLGYLWSFLKPLGLFCVLYIVFARMLRFGENIPNFPIYLLLGIVLWNFFVEVTSNGLGSIVQRSGVIKKIYFPRIIIVLVSSFSALINLFFNILILIILMIVFKIDVFHFHTLLVPLYIIELWAFGFSLALILSSLYVRFRDLSYIWELVLQILFYATPIIYPLSMIASPFDKYLMTSPIAQIITDFRQIFIAFEFPHIAFYPYSQILFIALTMILGLGIFYSSQKSFAEKL
ncbi:MAG TPA: ABC transporter permease [bacterium]|nr:ABC transporter permease [bacterium]HPN67286.1 ABC transporter permease [bacterium]